MKKIKYLLFALILSIILIPNVSAKSVEIKSITEVDKSDNTIIKSDPTYNGLEMNFDVAFKQKDDFVKYKVVIKNDTNTEYKISNDTSFNKSEYITYNYEVSGNLKPKGETTVYVTITYTKEVDPELMVDGNYPETNRAVIQLLDKEGTPANPNTGQKIIIMIILISLIILLSTILIIKKKNKLFSLIIVSLFLVPTLVYAIETLKLTINVKVEIEKGYTVTYIVSTSTLLTEQEAEEYNINPSECDSTYYIGEVTEGNKYYYCKTNLIKTDGVLYKSGSTVMLEPIITRSTSVGLNNSYYCPLQSEKIRVCDDTVTIEEYTLNTWLYSIGEQTFNPNGSPQDKEIMNFSNITEDKWETRRYIYINAPQAFTMPKHDVSFYIDNYGVT